jgi:hypothetical protein
MPNRENNEFKRSAEGSLRKLSVTVKTWEQQPIVEGPESTKIKTGSDYSNSNKLHSYNKTKGKKDSQENKVEKLDPDRISFHKSSLNFLFHLPFYCSITKITSAQKMGNTILFEAGINEEIKTLISNLVDQNGEVNSLNYNESSLSNYDLEIRVSVEISTDGKRKISISENKLEWLMWYNENENHIRVSYHAKDILYSKEQVKENVLSGKICPYCHCETNVVTDKDIFGPFSNFNKKFIQCASNPDHYVGTYRRGVSLGRLADKSLRQKKMAAHAAFDPLWKDRLFNSRDAAYEWLSNKMKLPKEETHFGLFDEKQCEKAIGIINRFAKRKNFFQSIFIYFKK